MTATFGQRFNPPYYTAFDTSGVVSPGALLFFYMTGTTTPANTYADVGLTIANSNPVVADGAGLFPSIFLTPGQQYKVVLETADGDQIWTADPVTNGGTVSNAGNLLGFLGGLTLSAAGGTGIFGIASGSAADSTGSFIMNLATAFTKTTAAWSIGTGVGGLDTGTIANTTWYHVYEIANLGTNSVDIIFSTSPVAPALPANYTLYRRIGAMQTDGSAHWKAFTQNGNEFLWLVPVSDANAVTSGVTTAITKTLSVATGIKVNALFNWAVGSSTSNSGTNLVSSLDETDTAASVTAFTQIVQISSSPGSVISSSSLSIRTNTSGQIRVRFGAADATYYIVTMGWIDTRGQG